MELNVSELLWALFNILIIFILTYFLYKVIKGAVRMVESTLKYQEAVINKLDELIESNKTIIEYLSNNDKVN